MGCFDGEGRGWLSVEVAAVLSLIASCGGATSNDADAGGPLPQAFLRATIGPTANDPTACQFSASDMPTMSVGSAAAGEPVPVTLDQPGHYGPAGACSVVASGAGFDAAAGVVLGGSNVMVYFETPRGKGAVTAAGATGVTVMAVANSYANAYYQQDDCTLSFTYEGQPIPVDPPVATGRIWGHLSCPNALLVNDPKYPTGFVPNTQCDVEVDFLLQDCNGLPVPRPDGFVP